MNIKTEEQLKRDISRNELWADCGGYAVIAGLIIEVGAAIVFSDKGVSAAEWGTVGSNVIVTLGVAAEVLFSRRARVRAEQLQILSDERISEANERAADAEARTKEAEVEILRLMEHARLVNSPRFMNADIFVQEISNLPKGHAIILYDRHVLDAHIVALSLAAAFQTADWDTETNLIQHIMAVTPAQIVPWHEQPQTNKGQSPWGISIAARKFDTTNKDDPINVLQRAILKSGADNTVYPILDESLADGAFRLIVKAKTPLWPRPKEDN